MQKAREAFNKIEIGREAPKFIVYFLYDDEEQSVHVEEAEEIDFSKIIQHLKFNGSVFITYKKYAIEELEDEVLRPSKERKNLKTSTSDTRKKGHPFSYPHGNK